MTRQRYRIYSFEDEQADDYTTPDGMQAWFDWVVRTKFWRDRSKVKHVAVGFPVTGGMSGAKKLAPHLARIDFGVFSLCRRTACHELAHILTWDADADAEEDHGPRFAGAYIAVVRRFISAQEAARMEKEFDERGIGWSHATQ